jgi:4'-phosphopantetheinyl transferase
VVVELPAANEVHVWSVDLRRPVGALGGSLTEDELLRAAAFRVEDGRRNFVASRTALRTLLGQYLQQDPAALRFAAGPRGKPRLDATSSLLQFNVTHSGTVGLIAIANGADVGIDVEEIKPRAHLDGIAKRVFTERERDAIDGELSFYRHWVAKEAFVKATGKGVASVRSFEVLLDAPGGARLVHVGGDPEEAARWTLAPLEAPAGYAAAVVASGTAITIRPPRPFRFEP